LKIIANVVEKNREERGSVNFALSIVLCPLAMSGK
jgi:hypothetical protein